ncbi:MAG TPA: Sec-independent protein translocase protein TatB [Rhizomicrobium sp.]|jgi:sec-independent protein translocase protein TatB|nr:Sec-independent protein translocase protein TatB [Rhizomicrobium sp.]
MFVDLSWSHILLLLIVALVVVGPKDLPRMMRMAGRWTAKARAMADQFRKSFDEMAHQSELDELRTELESLRGERPLADIDQALRAPVVPSPDPSPAVPEASDAADAEPVTDIAASGPPP